LNGSDILTNADFSIHDEPNNTYKISHTAVISSANAVWESGVKLTSATSIANVISTAGSSYYDNSTHTIYIHSVQTDPNPTTNGLIYEAATRGYVIDDNDNSWLIWQDLEVRQGYSELSAHLITGSDNIVRRMEYYDNSNHHLSFYGARNLGEDIYGENCAGGAFLFYSSSATTGNVFRRLNSVGNKSWTGSAIQSHGGAQGNIVEDSFLSQTVNQATQVGAVGISSTGTSIVIRRTKISGNWYYAFKTSTSGGVDSEFYGNLIDGTALRSTAISLFSGATNVKIYNNTYYTNASRVFFIPETGASVDDKNNIIYANDFYLGSSLDQLTADFNIYYGSARGTPFLTGGVQKNFSQWQALGFDLYGTTTNPLLSNAPLINFTLSSTSPAIDSGTVTDTMTSTSTDYAGNPIYGAPDIGAYEYQPPFTIGTDDLDITGDIRIYGDGKYRYTTATSSAMSANFSVAPPEGVWSYAASTTRPEWLNISDITWNTSGTYSKQWTASSTSATTTVYAIGDLAPLTYYTIAVDGAASTTQQSNGSGVITYTYSGGYSTHTFTVTPDTTGPSAPSLSSPANGGATSINPAFAWTASTDSESGLSKYQLYLDNELYTDNLSATSASASNQSCGSHSWFIRSTDNAGNTTDSGASTFSVICGSVIPFYSPSASVPRLAEPTAIPETNQPNAEEAAVNLIKAAEAMATPVEQIINEAGQTNLTDFISLGTVSTKILGSGERSGVIKSFESAFGRLPRTETDWADVIKIANGRWPSQKNTQTEANALAAFKKIYLRSANSNNPHDDAAVTIIAYGLRPRERNLNSERAAIKIFKAVYGYTPKSSMAWDIVRAIAYSGAKR